MGQNNLITAVIHVLRNEHQGLEFARVILSFLILRSNHPLLYTGFTCSKWVPENSVSLKSLQIALNKPQKP